MNSPFPDVKSILLDDAKLEKMMSIGKRFVERFLPDDGMPPQIAIATHADNEDGFQLTLCSVHGGFNASAEKRQILANLAFDSYDKQQIPLAVMLASEAWGSRDIEGANGKRKYAQPADDPNRREIIMLQLLTFDRKCLATVHDTERRGDELQLVGSWEESLSSQSFLLQAFYNAFFARAMRGAN